MSEFYAEQSRPVIEQETVAEVVGADGQNGMRSAIMHYDPNDPAAVSLIFISTKQHPEEVILMFARDMLEQMVVAEDDTWLGDGDVQIQSDKDSIRFHLSSPEGTAGVKLDRIAINHFLKDAREAVPDFETERYIFASRFDQELREHIPEMF